MSQAFDEMINRLNKEQQEAVRHTEGPLLIMAGAGSGKREYSHTESLT